MSNFTKLRKIITTGKLSSTEISVLTCLCFHGDFNTGLNIKPSLQRLSFLTNLTTKPIIAALKSIEKKGFLVVKRSTGKRNLYFLVEPTSGESPHHLWNNSTPPVENLHSTSGENDIQQIIYNTNTISSNSESKDKSSFVVSPKQKNNNNTSV